jgi:Fe-S oxidoreductase/nitrate reductase gamma subunit
MNPDDITREIFWNIPLWAHVLMYVLAGVAGGLFAYGVGRRVRRWRAGRPSRVEGTLGARLGQLLRHGIAQVRIWRSALAGASHSMVFWAMIVLAIVTTIVAIEDYRILHLFYGDFYRVVSLAADLFGIVLIAGCLIAIARRYIDRRCTPLARPIDAAILWSLLAIAITGFLVEGLRIAATDRAEHSFERVAFVGWILAGWLERFPPATLRPWHLGLWLLHMLLTMALIAAIPFTKLRHLVFAPLQLALADPRTSVKYHGVSIEEVEETGRYGANRVADFTWQELLSFDACTECARCQSVCPAHATGKPLSPMRVVLDLAGTATAETPLHAQVITAETLWACTSCRACVAECPVLIHQLGAIVDLRRGLVGEGEIRGGEQAALRSIGGVGNPWGLPPDERAAWAEGLDVPTIDDVPHPELLFWVGCAGSYDRRNQKVSRALVAILKAANVPFAILGNHERCTGDPARRMGDEFTFQAAAEANIERLNQVHPQRIVTACPHCFNTLKNEYPDYGATFDVVHHTQLIDELIRAGRLKLDPSAGPRTVLHDACYLGRYNEEYAAPRKILNRAGAQLTEIAQSRQNAFCCGCGGGRMWMEEKLGTRINRTRWQQLMAAHPQQVAVNCPFCMTMLSDAAADLESDIAIQDVAEIVAGALRP